MVCGFFKLKHNPQVKSFGKKIVIYDDFVSRILLIDDFWNFPKIWHLGENQEPYFFLSRDKGLKGGI